MADTSSATFDCATKNWKKLGSSQQTSTSSTSQLTDFLTELKTANKSSFSNKKNKQLIKNGNGLDEQFGISDLIKKKSTEVNSSDNLILNSKLNNNSTLSDTLSDNSSSIKSFELNDLPLNNQQKSNLSTTNQNSNSITNSINQSNEQKSSFNHHQNESLTESSNHRSRKDIIFKIGYKLEACDTTGTWYPSKVVAINEEDNQVLIHFVRWSSKYDEWMSMDSDQLRALTKEDDENSETESQKSFSIGKLVLASWSDNKKYPGQVLSVTSDGNYNIRFFDGYRKKVKKSLVEQIPDDYQINFNSPLGRFFLSV